MMSVKCVCDVCMSEEGVGCRVCDKKLCTLCYDKWLVQCRANRKNVDCPFCRSLWHMPNYFIEVKGTYCCTHVDVICSDASYVIFPIYDDDDVIGMVVLDPDLLHGEVCLHVSKLNDLARFASNWKWFFESVENNRCAFATTVDHTEHMLGQLKKAGVEYTTLVDDETGPVFGTEHMSDFIKSAQILDIGFF